jgi:hypothetical protein
MHHVYLLQICRVITDLLFFISLFGKMSKPRGLFSSIEQLKLIPPWTIPFAGGLVLLGEAGVVLALALGGRLLLPGFVLALALLGIFSLALGLALRRGIRTPCHCFGASERPVSRYDLWRNAGFALCALGGCGALALPVAAPGQGAQSLPLAAWGMIGMASAVFVVVWSQLGEIMELVQGSRVFD